MSRDLDELTGGKPIIGRRSGGEPLDEAEHFYSCPECSQAVDMRDLAQVLHHHEAGHAPLSEKDLSSRAAKVMAGSSKQ